MDWVGQVFV